MKKPILNSAFIFITVVFLFPLKALSLDAGVNPPDKSINLKLITYAESGNLKGVREALAAGADINAVDERKNTALIMAAHGGHVRTVKFLLEKGADISARDYNGRTALEVAGNEKNTKIVEILKTAASKSAPEIKSGGKSPKITGLANPASVNCHEKKGELKIVKGPGGGEYGICIFEDNRQCEEWAMFRGECPEGGVKITGYYTPEGVFCAITGGSYDEKAGKCTLKDGKVCGAVEHYKLECR